MHCVGGPTTKAHILAVLGVTLVSMNHQIMVMMIMTMIPTIMQKYNGFLPQCKLIQGSLLGFRQLFFIWHYNQHKEIQINEVCIIRRWVVN